jgi:hypothetical protein
LSFRRVGRPPESDFVFKLTVVPSHPNGEADEEPSKSQTSSRSKIRAECARGEAMLAENAHSPACHTPAVPESTARESDELSRMMANPLGQLCDGRSSVGGVPPDHAPGQRRDRRGAQLLRSFIR